MSEQYCCCQFRYIFITLHYFRVIHYSVSILWKHKSHLIAWNATGCKITAFASWYDVHMIYPRISCQEKYISWQKIAHFTHVCVQTNNHLSCTFNVWNDVCLQFFPLDILFCIYFWILFCCSCNLMEEESRLPVPNQHYGYGTTNQPKVGGLLGELRRFVEM